MYESRESTLAVVAAIARNGVIGVDNRLPWRLPDDLKRFRALTVGHTIIMGRRTWESLRGPLADRQNIVVTRNPDYRAPDAEMAPSLSEAIARATRPRPVFCIGGEKLFEQVLPIADTLHLTEIDRDFFGDVHFPPFARSEWREVAREAHSFSGDDGFDYAFVTYRRIAPLKASFTEHRA